MDAPHQGEPAIRAGGWHYLPPLDVSQSNGSTEIITVVVNGARFTPIPLATSSAAVVVAGIDYWADILPPTPRLVPQCHP